jgi:hypothetical protein
MHVAEGAVTMDLEDLRCQFNSGGFRQKEGGYDPKL